MDHVLVEYLILVRLEGRREGGVGSSDIRWVVVMESLDEFQFQCGGNNFTELECWLSEALLVKATIAWYVSSKAISR